MTYRPGEPYDRKAHVRNRLTVGRSAHLFQVQSTCKGRTADPAARSRNR
jgi:hypothetical protein